MSLKFFSMRCIVMTVLTAFSTSMFAQHTYYISSSTGSDSNTSAQAQSESTPWAHLPGMPSCSENCGSYTPVAGDKFILKGGDTWTASDLGVNWTWNGTNAARMYIGVDQTWYVGSAWVRPIFNCQNTGCAWSNGGNILWLAGNYVTVDNIEFTGYQQSGDGGTIISTYGNYNTVSNFYIHGFSRTSDSSSSNSYALSNNFSGGGGIGTNFSYNVIDGADSPNQDFMGGILHGDVVTGNIIRYVYDGMNGSFNIIEGNLIEYNYLASSGDHCNMMFPQDVFTGSTLIVANNIVRHAGCSGGSTVYTLGNSDCTTCTAYVYNNILYDNELSFDAGFTAGSHGATGTYYFYNNTVDTPGGYCIANSEPPPRSAAHYGNMHCISQNNICLGIGTTCVDDGGNLLQTEAQAYSAGYTASQTYAYSPTSSNSPTVGAGLSRSSFCSGALADLCSDIAYPTYNTSNHTVTVRTIVPRNSTWDAGAYQYSTGSTRPSPPTSLTVTVH